ncbi:hypothetical protein C8Q77DRAFT_157318 [Trametes polyzona]|nr:hypothetical protein C8Q77DRAFT_157318 [Trametes polyzona]
MPQRASSPGDPFTASDWEQGPRSSSVEPLDQADLIASDEEERPIYELDRPDIANAQYTFRFRRPTSADADNSLYLTGRDVSPPRTDAIGASDSDDQLPEPLHQPPSKSLFDILDWSKNVVDSKTKATPYRHSTSSSLSQDHSRDSVYNILRDVLRTQAREIATESWLHGVMELDRETHATLAEQIAEADWENKPEIRAALQKIQAATKEIDTYDPFCQVLNYILEHASALPFVQGNPGSTDRITELRFLPHFKKMIKRGFEPDVRGAGRFPDVVGMTRTVEETQWHMLPVTCELKFHNKDACNERGVPHSIPSSASSLVDDFTYENPLDLESASTAASTSIQTSPIQTPPSANVAALAPIGTCSSPSATAAASPSVGTLPPAHVAAPPSVGTPPSTTVTALPTIGTRSSFAATVAESLPAGAPSPPPITPVFAAPAAGASPILNSPAVSNVLPSTSNDLVRATSPAKPSTKRPRARHTTEGERARKRLNIYGRTAPLVKDDRIAACQATSNALETLRYSHGARFSCISITYVDDRFAFWYYDPCGIVKSDKKLSFFEDFARTAAVFVALGRMSSRRWGQLPEFTPPAGTSFPYANLTGFTVELRDPSTPEERPLTATLGRPIHTLYEVVGRRSFVYEAELARPGEDAGTHVSMVAKVAFQASTRVEEHTLIQHARERSVPHIPEIHAHRDLYEIVTFADSVWQRLQHLESIDNPFGDIEKRVARVIVFTRYFPLKERLLRYPEDLVRMVDQIKEGERAAHPHMLVILSVC